MEYQGTLDSQELEIQKLISNFLRSQVSSNALSTDGQHLDEDSLSAFVEGNLGKREATPIVNHLVDCGFCLNVTAELVKLDSAFADESQEVIAAVESPSKISQVLNGILAKIFGTNDGVVFAHQEQDESEDETRENDSDKEN